MQLTKLKLYNTLHNNKEVFEPLNYPYVGIYLCGPTVYSDAHLGHARSVVTFDILVRYLSYLNYKVKYVRNITDVGHLERDSDYGEDKIAKRAILEDLDVMEVAQKYTNSFHDDIKLLNVIRPNIEPIASGHILEQIELIKKIIYKGYAYEINGSVYFDVKKYSEDNINKYGILSNRVLEDLISNTRDLEGQKEKKYSLDFALWKKASPNHIMKWESPWSLGFPGWHLECSAMSMKYLGDEFDIHGGGMDLCFPHHECEIAQSYVTTNRVPAKFWVHNNMITVNGQKMSKSLNNFITLKSFYQGNHELLEKAYHPMVLRFFILQAHYRSTLSFSNEALRAAEKGYYKIVNTLIKVKEIKFNHENDEMVSKELVEYLDILYNDCINAMNDDLNTAKLIAILFDLTKVLNSFINQEKDIRILGINAFKKLKSHFITFVEDILGITEPKNISPILLDLVIQLYKESKKNKKYEIVDSIRESLKKEGIIIEDKKFEISWRYVNTN